MIGLYSCCEYLDDDPRYDLTAGELIVFWSFALLPVILFALSRWFG